MGIHNFHTFIKNKYPNSIKKIWLNHYDYIYIDINYCLHNIAHNALSLDDVILKLIGYIKNILKYNIPLKEVILVTDGPAPFAKLFLQRKRRLGMNKTKTETETETNSNLSIHFTPGTIFMNILADKLCEFVKYIKFIFSINVILLFDEADEGEIKIKNTLLINCSLNNNASHLIVSNDADVVLLACCTETTNNIYILSKIIENYTINIKELINEHCKYFQTNNKWDIVALSLLIGNDYIPKISFNTFDKLWNAYNYALKLDKNGLLTSLNPLIINKEFLINILLSIILQTQTRYIKLFTTKYLNHNLYNNYIEGYTWCLDMYINGKCADYDYIFKYQDDNVHPLGLLYTLYNYNDKISYKNSYNIITKEPINKILYCMLLLPYHIAILLIDDKYHNFLEEIKYINESKHILLTINDINEIIEKFNLYI